MSRFLFVFVGFFFLICHIRGEAIIGRFFKSIRCISKRNNQGDRIHQDLALRATSGSNLWCITYRDSVWHGLWGTLKRAVDHSRRASHVGERVTACESFLALSKTCTSRVNDEYYFEIRCEYSKWFIHLKVFQHERVYFRCPGRTVYWRLPRIMGKQTNTGSTNALFCVPVQ